MANQQQQQPSGQTSIGSGKNGMYTGGNHSVGSTGNATSQHDATSKMMNSSGAGKGELYTPYST